jgi:hypothetical protein
MIEHPDKMVLIEHPAFRRFLLDLLQRAGVFDVTSSVSDGRNMFLEGRRSLALEILRDLDEAQAIKNPEGLPALTLIQTLGELLQSAPLKKTSTRESGIYADVQTDPDE